MSQPAWNQRLTLRGGLTLANRLVVAPMTTYASQADGQISEDELPYLRRRAAGGFGMVMTAACCVHPRGKAFRGQWACWADEFLPSLRSVAQAIREGGSTSVLQLHHGGRQCPPELCGGTPLSASAVAADRPNAVQPSAMTEEEIDATIRAFAEAAVRARDTGFDGVEIHGANTYLLQQFVSPHSNRRLDRWGQSRLAFPLAVTDAVLDAVGDGFAVGYRFSPEEKHEPGITLEHTRALVHALCERPLDWLHVSLQRWDQGSIRGEGGPSVLSQLVEWVGDRVPLMGVGAVRTSADAEAVLAEGAALVAIGRAAITEPEWPQRVLSGAPARLTVPKDDAGDRLTLPRGLAEKIYATPGWFDVDE